MNKFELKDSSLENKVSPASLEIKEISEDGTFEGYASVFGETDLGMDVVVAGAFKKSISSRTPRGVKLLWQHNPDEPIGKWTELVEDKKGLKVKGRLFLTIQKGREAHELMKEDAIDGLSIGYQTKIATFDENTGTRYLKEVDLREVSIVTFPMNEGASATLTRKGQLPTEREFEEWLVRDAGFTTRQAKAIIADGFKSLKTVRDASLGDTDSLLAALRSARSGLS